MDKIAILLPSGNWVALITYGHAFSRLSHPAYTQAILMEDDDARVKFLQDYPWAPVTVPAFVSNVDFLPVNDPERKSFTLSKHDLSTVNDAISALPSVEIAANEVRNSIMDIFLDIPF